MTNKFDGPYMTIVGVDVIQPGMVIQIRFANGDVREMASDTIRRATDRDFAEHYKKIADEQAILIGKGITKLRGGVSREELAVRAKVPLHEVRRLEEGNEPSFVTLSRVLNGLGCSAADLATATKDLR